ncbi:hypothetical protein NSK_005757 [Nannochloropsis salina CCMP1776]|uniref:Uncharacterized protein n=1 Tax=Nannochloropsis salina CCMP1776 TaxID=1027361 RepID=A0A4D9CUL4_9STRA|nr:hypothetical protein NSK_005757 [Nannochloropsis salina CCMP1776]|eukprot:TFJ82932.1 hypothetical protein NSK_005757 [Nannochloropsis salina CCMP1776]
MATARGPQVRRASIIVTGFGQFMGVTDNPTQHLIEALQGKLSKGPDGGAAEDPDGGQTSVLTCLVMEVSAAGAKEAVERLHCYRPGTQDGREGGREVGTRKERGAEDGKEGGVEEGGPLIFLHMGVDAEATCFKLHQPSGDPICSSIMDLTHCYYSTIDLHGLAQVGGQGGREGGSEGGSGS